MNFKMRMTAIVGAWAVGRSAGIGQMMTHNVTVRKAMIAAWKAGYRYAQRQAKKEAGK